MWAALHIHHDLIQVRLFDQCQVVLSLRFHLICGQLCGK
jgi:hypothetical protein